MRIVLFDGLLETHVADSLERALRMRGHVILNTGKIGHGFSFETRTTQLRAIENTIDGVLDFKPDFILVFRPATLPPAQLNRLRAAGAQIAVWLSDDPVLWNLSYRPIIDSYDIVMHSGSEKVVSFYDEHFGRAVGVNVPFWTDNIAFPYVYGKHLPESTAMFLGNVHDKVRRRRYYALSDLDISLRIHGNTGLDFKNMSGGYLESDAEVVDAAARTLVAINIPQYFSDHRGLDTWFDGLDELGTFQYPSRVIQYAAMGLPIVSVAPVAEDYRTFPELQLVKDVASSAAMIREITQDQNRLNELSRATHARFKKHYSAESRALAIESLSTDDSWRKLSSADRAEWFTQFDGTNVGIDNSGVSTPAQAHSYEDCLPDRRESTSLPNDSNTNTASSVLADAEKVGGLRVAMIGEGWTRAASQVSTLFRAVSRCGHTPINVNPVNCSSLFIRDKSKEFRAFIDVPKLYGQFRPDVIILVGAHYIVSMPGREYLTDHGIPLVTYGVNNRTVNVVNTKLAERSDLIAVSHPDLLKTLQTAGFTNVFKASPLVDEAFLESAAANDLKNSKIRVIGDRRADLSRENNLLQDLMDVGAELDFIDERADPPFDVHSLLEYVTAAVTVVAPNTALPGVQFSDFMGYALAAGSIVVSPRTPGIDVGGIPGITHITARDRYELIRKLDRLRSDEHEFHRYVSSAKNYIDQHYRAEHVVSALIRNAISNLKMRDSITGDLSIKSSTPKSGVLSSIAWESGQGNGANRVSVGIRFYPPSVSELLADLVLRIYVDGSLGCEARLMDLVGESQVHFSGLDEQTGSRVTVELFSENSLAFFNWRDLVNVNVDIWESRHASSFYGKEITSSNGGFVKARRF